MRSPDPFKGEPESLRGRPAYGSTVNIAHSSVHMRYGECTAYIFQDIVHKGHIIALAYGDIKNAESLHTRLHSRRPLYGIAQSHPLEENTDGHEFPGSLVLKPIYAEALNNQNRDVVKWIFLEDAD